MFDLIEPPSSIDPSGSIPSNTYYMLVYKDKNIAIQCILEEGRETRSMITSNYDIVEAARERLKTLYPHIQYYIIPLDIPFTIPTLTTKENIS